MEFRRLGDSGLQVSRICLGTMMFSQPTDAAEADRIVGMARDAGINFVDTADFYGHGGSERMLGAAIARDRDRWVVATKVGLPMGAGPHRSGLGRKWMLRAIDDSLSRLGTDHVDIWYLHTDDRTTPLEETLSAAGDAIRAGKVRYLGLSNFDGWRMVEAVRLCQRMGLPQPIVSQPLYNLATRGNEAEHLPACRALGLGVVPYSPLARGVLTGKYRAGATPPAESRAGRGNKRLLETEFRPESFALAEAVRAHAAARGLTAEAFAVAWVLANRLVTSVLAGPRTVEQWQGYLAAAAVMLDADDEAFVDGLVAPGHASTPGYTDPSFPVRGRIVAASPSRAAS
ncbi:aryl-alcohol dehydrogenase (NADP+) [Stella humosa]|uniref:Aryl-alcohol dehydrogenase (NADP+) n=1 Tax=Stella humosa TaxID=94 RepID=A0A3N1MGA7_9PROT|nr:aldo/keto reductase [Stella humosa]ROQ01787.1 aryl-alcohol dehydrogenase (NADP+) [Stella humosa]BBK32173.1 oxidoreductase [Stella humosa]